MSGAQGHYSIGLDKNPANFVALSPLSFLERSASVYPHFTSAVYEGRTFTWARLSNGANALPRSSRATELAVAIPSRQCCRISRR